MSQVRIDIPWPRAVTSWGYFPPEVVVQIPIPLFAQLLEAAPKDQHPEWAQAALDSGASFALMFARTLYELIEGEDISLMEKYFEEHPEAL